MEEARTRWVWSIVSIPAIGILALSYATYAALRRRRFGESVFEMASVPGVVGGPLSGIVRIPALVQPESGFRLRLLCMSQARDHDGKQKHERVLWQDEHFVAKAMGGDGADEVAVPVLMAIPFGTRPTTSAGDDSLRIRWLLEISAELPGVNYKTEFEVPVFKTPESRADFQIDRELAQDYASAPNNDLFLQNAGIIKRPGSLGGVRLEFPAGRNLGSSLVLTFLAIVFCGVAWFMFKPSMMIIFSLVFGLFGILLTFMALDGLFHRSVVEAWAEGLTVRGGLFGMGRTHAYTASDIVGFTSSESMSSGKHVWCNISVKTRRTNRGRLAKGSEASWPKRRSSTSLKRPSAESEH